MIQHNYYQPETVSEVTTVTAHIYSRSFLVMTAIEAGDSTHLALVCIPRYGNQFV